MNKTAYLFHICISDDPSDLDSLRRISLFLSTIRYYFQIKIKRYDSVDDFLKEQLYLKFPNFLIFFQCFQTPIETIFPLLQKQFHQKIVIFDTEDVHFLYKFLNIKHLVSCIVLNSGIAIDARTPIEVFEKVFVPGYGFAFPYPILKNIISFNERKEIFYFRGSIRYHNPARQDMLKKIKTYTNKTNITIVKSGELIHVDYLKDIMKYCDFFGHTIPEEQTWHEMNLHKFALVPTGNGNTWRVLESFSQGICCLANDLDNLNLILPFFKDGYNYLSVGKNNEKLKEVVDFCLKKRNQPLIEIISNNALKTYTKYFFPNKGCMPLVTFRPLIGRINSLTNNFFLLNFKKQTFRKIIGLKKMI